MLGTEVGYRTLIVHKLYVDVDFFHNHYNDLYGYGPGIGFVELSPAPPHLVLQEPLANALEGDTAGIEIAPDWKPTSWWELKGSYSYLHLFVKDRPGFTDTTNTAADNGSSPHHEVTVQSQFNLPRRFEFDPTYRYVSSLSYVSAFPGQHIKAYSTADVRFGWHAAASWELSVVGQNLLQPQHAEFGSDVATIVGIDRAVYGKVTWTRE